MSHEDALEIIKILENIYAVLVVTMVGIAIIAGCSLAKLDK